MTNRNPLKDFALILIILAIVFGPGLLAGLGLAGMIVVEAGLIDWVGLGLCLVAVWLIGHQVAEWFK